MTLVALAQADESGSRDPSSIVITDPDGGRVQINGAAQEMFFEAEQGFSIIHVSLPLAKAGRYVFRVMGSSGGEVTAPLDVRFATP